MADANDDGNDDGNDPLEFEYDDDSNAPSVDGFDAAAAAAPAFNGCRISSPSTIQCGTGFNASIEQQLATNDGIAKRSSMVSLP